jgi:hypothetical protein
VTAEMIGALVSVAGIFGSVVTIHNQVLTQTLESQPDES